MNKLVVGLGCVLCLCFASVTLAQQADDVVGVWVTAKGDSRIEIYEKAQLYFGRIVALKEPTYKPGEVDGMAGKARVDRNNPDKSLRNRPLLGLVLMTGFSFDDGVWRGRIYNPRNGKTYRSNMSLREDGSLRLRGYIGVPWLGRTTVWQRPRD